MFVCCLLFVCLFVCLFFKRRKKKIRLFYIHGTIISTNIGSYLLKVVFKVPLLLRLLFLSQAIDSKARTTRERPSLLAAQSLRVEQPTPQALGSQQGQQEAAGRPGRPPAADPAPQRARRPAATRKAALSAQRISNFESQSETLDRQTDGLSAGKETGLRSHRSKRREEKGLQRRETAGPGGQVSSCRAGPTPRFKFTDSKVENIETEEERNGASMHGLASARRRKDGASADNPDEDDGPRPAPILPPQHHHIAAGAAGAASLASRTSSSSRAQMTVRTSDDQQYPHFPYSHYSQQKQHHQHQDQEQQHVSSAHHPHLTLHRSSDLNPKSHQAHQTLHHHDSNDVNLLRHSYHSRHHPPQQQQQQQQQRYHHHGVHHHSVEDDESHRGHSQAQLRSHSHESLPYPHSPSSAPLPPSLSMSLASSHTLQPNSLSPSPASSLSPSPPREPQHKQPEQQPEEAAKRQLTPAPPLGPRPPASPAQARRMLVSVQQHQSGGGHGSHHHGVQQQQQQQNDHYHHQQHQHEQTSPGSWTSSLSPRSAGSPIISAGMEREGLAYTVDGLKVRGTEVSPQGLWGRANWGFADQDQEWRHVQQQDQQREHLRGQKMRSAHELEQEEFQQKLEQQLDDRKRRGKKETLVQEDRESTSRKHVSKITPSSGAVKRGLVGHGRDHGEVNREKEEPWQGQVNQQRRVEENGRVRRELAAQFSHAKLSSTDSPSTLLFEVTDANSQHNVAVHGSLMTEASNSLSLHQQETSRQVQTSTTLRRSSSSTDTIKTWPGAGKPPINDIRPAAAPLRLAAAVHEGSLLEEQVRVQHPRDSNFYSYYSQEDHHIDQQLREGLAHTSGPTTDPERDSERMETLSDAAATEERSVNDDETAAHPDMLMSPNAVTSPRARSAERQQLSSSNDADETTFEKLEHQSAHGKGHNIAEANLFSSVSSSSSPGAAPCFPSSSSYSSQRTHFRLAGLSAGSAKGQNASHHDVQQFTREQWEHEGLATETGNKHVDMDTEAEAEGPTYTTSGHDDESSKRVNYALENSHATPFPNHQQDELDPYEDDLDQLSIGAPARQNVLDRLKLLAVIGEGAFGRVYLTEWRNYSRNAHERAQLIATQQQHRLNHQIHLPQRSTLASSSQVALRSASSPVTTTATSASTSENENAASLATQGRAEDALTATYSFQHQQHQLPSSSDGGRFMRRTSSASQAHSADAHGVATGATRRSPHRDLFFEHSLSRNYRHHVTGTARVDSSLMSFGDIDDESPEVQATLTSSFSVASSSVASPKRADSVPTITTSSASAASQISRPLVFTPPPWVFRDDRLVAVKVMRKSDLNTAELRRQAEMEVQVLRTAAAFPFIADFVFACQTPTKLYVGMEFCAAGDFFSFMSQQLHRREDVPLYIGEIALALDYLHGHNILFRDLKPENIALSARGHVRLIDFGLSIFLDSNEALINENGRREVITACGTLSYTAPEVLRRKTHSYESDWWSLGVIAYELFTGFPPYEGRNEQETCDMICTEDFEPAPPVVPGTAEYDLIRRLLVRDQQPRLGYRRSDASIFFNHALFMGINWEDVLEERVPVNPIFQEESNSYASCLANFSEEFTAQAPIDFVAPQESLSAPSTPESGATAYTSYSNAFVSSNFEHELYPTIPETQLQQN